MKLINFGSLNIDRVYAVPRTAATGETVSAGELHIYPGGKGLNQSIAAARAGARVLHAGAAGPDGDFLVEALAQAKVDVSHLLRTDGETGHAVIQVSPDGQNSILVYGGANRALTVDYVNHILDLAEPGDLVLLQNETGAVPEIISAAHGRGLRVAFNPSPFPSEPMPYELVDIFLVNELEGAALAGLAPDAEPAEVLTRLAERYPRSTVVLTLGEKGVFCAQDGQIFIHLAFPVKAVDTTAAGDTFTGYFLAALGRGEPLLRCLKVACAASALAVSRPGASPSIPTRDEVEGFLSDPHRV